MNEPEPLTPPECDLRGYEYMPLIGVRLFGSEFYSHALRNPRAGLAAMKLWWEAWQQCPAGSLPSDDFSLCRLADFGTDTRAWEKAREIALHGFVLCSDGRLYHPLICNQALQAHAKRTKGRERKAKWRASKDGDGPDGPDDVPRDETGTGRGRKRSEAGTERAYRTGQDRTGTEERKKEGRSLRSLAPSGAAGGDPEFADFYAKYPRKKQPLGALKAWRSARKQATTAEIMAGLAHHRFNPDPTRIPYPSSWLNAGAWKDEPDPTVRPLNGQRQSRMDRWRGMMGEGSTVADDADSLDGTAELFPPRLTATGD